MEEIQVEGPPEPTVEEGIIEVVQAVDQLSHYGALIGKTLIVLICGLVAVSVLHKFAAQFLYPRLQNRRLLKVVFGSLYVMALVVASLLAIEQLGFETTRLARLAIVVVLIGSVIAFFLAPFFPRLPFKLGHMVDIDGVLGIVEAISTFHTTIRTFEGQLVHIPNQQVLNNPIVNYHDLPDRRVDLNLWMTTNSPISEVCDMATGLMRADSRVLDDPAPVAFVISSGPQGTEISARAWVRNSDFFGARSDLWTRAVDAVNASDTMDFVKPQHEVYTQEI